MRHATAAGLDLIRRYEGFSPVVYLCPAGLPTIGHGHVVRGDAERARFAAGITPADAADLLAHDAEVAERAVARLVPVPLTDGQFDALVSFAFNLGAGALQRSTLRQRSIRGEHHDVPAEFLRWTRAGGRILPGLLRRRQAEAMAYQGK